MSEDNNGRERSRSPDPAPAAEDEAPPAEAPPADSY
eukprot:CAMPEP_0172455926 /NCGR_PEP_ID=MMETSP1065-20121228/13120_1 /TAXON_ID=265537 /ORGANISM="Amphiprora paludosa, Strain CCMP125" /LENGTH=35 /DNA_ID= /DNA_START= /DNA_END= /DNA_ORIENTATION=